MGKQAQQGVQQRQNKAEAVAVSVACAAPRICLGFNLLTWNALRFRRKPPAQERWRASREAALHYLLLLLGGADAIALRGCATAI